MHKSYIALGALLGAVAVALGAFGAHGLKKIVPPETVSTFETGVRYQVYHTLAIIFSGILLERFNNRPMKLSGIFFLLGIILFSGSLYLLTFLKATDTVGLEGIGAITPIGGVFFILGWVLMMVGVTRKKE